jgi:hypothetical protein
MSIVEMEDASCVGLSVVVDDSNSGWIIMEDKLFGNADSGIKRGDLRTSRVVTEDDESELLYTNAASTRRMTNKSSVETTIIENCCVSTFPLTSMGDMNSKPAWQHSYPPCIPIDYHITPPRSAPSHGKFVQSCLQRKNFVIRLKKFVLGSWQFQGCVGKRTIQSSSDCQVRDKGD